MPGPDLFLDSSALFAGVVSATGAARALLMLAEAGTVAITVSEQVVAETERALARRCPWRWTVRGRRSATRGCVSCVILRRRT